MGNNPPEKYTQNYESKDRQNRVRIELPLQTTKQVIKPQPEKPQVKQLREVNQNDKINLQQRLKSTIEKQQWYKCEKSVKKLPQVKPPSKKNFVKKVKDIKQNIEDELAQIEELSNIKTDFSDIISQQYVSVGGKTTHLITSKQNILTQFGKTKKCRVSRML